MSDVILAEYHAGILQLTINRPEVRNAINEQAITQLQTYILQANADRECRAIVLTGSGDRAFCAGADLQSSDNGGAFRVDYSRPQHPLVNLFKVVQQSTVPLIAKVNGHVTAGGFGLLCACDMAVMSEDARFGTTESKVGVTPMMILPFMLRVLPLRRLQEMCITGELFSAKEALDWGVVNYVVPRSELDAKIDWLLARICDKSPTAIRLGKQAYSAMQDMSLRDSLEYAQVMVPIMSSTADAREGITAFVQKRPPQWPAR